MIEQSIVVNRTFEAATAAQLVQNANRFKSRISLRAAEKTANVKSIMGIISLGLEAGTQVTVAADGEDANEAISELVKILGEPPKQ